MVMLCKQLMLARDKSPTSVTELYDKFICIEIYELLLLEANLFSCPVIFLIKEIKGKGEYLSKILRKVCERNHSSIINVMTLLYV